MGADDTPSDKPVHCAPEQPGVALNPCPGAGLHGHPGVVSLPCGGRIDRPACVRACLAAWLRAATPLEGNKRCRWPACRGQGAWLPWRPRPALVRSQRSAAPCGGRICASALPTPAGGTRNLPAQRPTTAPSFCPGDVRMHLSTLHPPVRALFLSACHARQMPAARSCRVLPSDVRGVQRSPSGDRKCGRRPRRRFLARNHGAMRATCLLADCPPARTHAMALDGVRPASIGRWIH